MTTYYLSNGGSDSASGQSITTPWASLSRLKTELLAGSITRYDTVLFNRGDEFYGLIENIPAAPAGSTSRLVLGSYGNGPKPIINGYKILNTAGSWVLHATGVWKIDLSNTSLFTGNTMTTDANVGFINVDGSIKAAKRWSVGTLVDPWDFYCDTTTLYVKATANPTTLAADIRVVVNKSGILAASSTLISGLDIKGFGQLAVNIKWITNVEVIGCDLHEIGGSWLGTGTTRYGNGLQVWIGASNILAHFNNVWDVYEVAFTLQGSQTATELAWTDVHIRNNRVWNCGQSFETWSMGSDFSAGTGFVRCSFTDNVCLNAGYAWSQIWKTQPGIGTHLLNYNMQLPTNLEIKRNVFFDAVDNYFFKNTGAVPAGYDVDDNDIFLRAGKKVQYQTAQTIENYQDWVTATGMDVNSRWISIPDTVVTLDDAAAFIAAHNTRESASLIALEKGVSDTLANNAATLEQVQQQLTALSTPGRLATPLLGTQAYGQAGAVTSISGVAAPEGWMQGWVLTPGRSCALGKIGVNVATAGSAGAVVRLAIYELTLGASNTTGVLLLDAGTVDSTTTGVKSVTINQPIEAGKSYLVAAAGQGAASTAAILSTNAGVDTAIGSSEATQAVTRLLGYQVSSVTGAAPSTPTFGAAGNVIRTIISAVS